jgi:UMF1 family MFS transporter
MVMELSPEDKFGEYFGFSKLSGKISSAVGPLIMGLVLSTADFPFIGKTAYALAMITLGVIMAAGILIISFVEYPDKSELK